MLLLHRNGYLGTSVVSLCCMNSYKVVRKVITRQAAYEEKIPRAKQNEITEEVPMFLSPHLPSFSFLL